MAPFWWLRNISIEFRRCLSNSISTGTSQNVISWAAIRKNAFFIFQACFLSPLSKTRTVAWRIIPIKAAHNLLSSCDGIDTNAKDLLGQTAFAWATAYG